jgi:hypothetical protein
MNEFTKELQRQRALTKHFIIGMAACLIIGVPTMVLIIAYAHTLWGLLAILPYFISLPLYMWRTR